MSAARAGRRGPDAPVAYLTKRFPRLSETFILDEILGLERAGVPLRLFAVAHPGEGLVQPDVARVVTPVHYLRGRGWTGVVRGIGGTLWAHGRLAARHPGRYRRAFAAARRERARTGTIRPFLDAGRLAVRLRRQRVRHLHAAFAHGPASTARFVHLLTGLPYSFAAHAKDLFLSDPGSLSAKAADAAFVMTCSAAAAAALAGRTGGAPIVLAHHGVDTERFRPPARTGVPGAAPAGMPAAAPAGTRPSAPAGTRPSAPAGTPAAVSAGTRPSAPAGTPGTAVLRILAVGRLVPKKGYPVLLAALRQVLDAGHEVHCSILGGGPDEEPLRRQIAALGLADRVRLLGARTHQEVAAAYREADVFVQASVVLADGDRDGIPNALLEAMASGLPVVASDVAGIPEAVTHGVSGLLVPPGDPAALADALGRLAADPDLAGRLSAGARAGVVAEFDRRVCARRVADVFAAVAR